MRIVRSDDEKLILVDCAVFFGAFALAGGLWCFYAAGARLLGHGDPEMPWWAPLLVGVFFLFFVVVFTKRNTWEFDLVSRTLRWKRQGVLGTKQGSIGFDEIQRLYVDYRLSDGSDMYRLCLSTRNGAVPFTTAYSTGHRGNYEQIKTRIEAALKMTAADKVEDQILELVQQGRKIDAITLTRRRFGWDLTRAKQFVEDLGS